MECLIWKHISLFHKSKIVGRWQKLSTILQKHFKEMLFNHFNELNISFIRELFQKFWLLNEQTFC